MLEPDLKCSSLLKEAEINRKLSRSIDKNLVLHIVKTLVKNLIIEELYLQFKAFPISFFTKMDSGMIRVRNVDRSF
jgi:hypothetical protein